MYMYIKIVKYRLMITTYPTSLLKCHLSCTNVQMTNLRYWGNEHD